MGLFYSLQKKISVFVSWCKSKIETTSTNYLRSSSYYPVSKNIHYEISDDTSSESVWPVPRGFKLLERPLSYLQMEQLDEYPMPNYILEMERDDNISLSSKEWIE